MSDILLNPPRQFRLLVTLIVLIGFAMVLAATIQLTLRADTPAANFKVTIDKAIITPKEELAVTYGAPPLGNQADGTRTILTVAVSVDGSKAIERQLTSSGEPNPISLPLAVFQTADKSLKGVKTVSVTAKLIRHRSGQTLQTSEAVASGSPSELRTKGVFSPGANRELVGPPASLANNQQPVTNNQKPPVLPDGRDSLGTGTQPTTATQEQSTTPNFNPDGKPEAPTEFGPLNNLGQYATKIMAYALPLGIALAVIMTIYAGILFMVSQGQPDRLKDAQEIIQGAILGLIILIMARFMVNFLILPGTETESGPLNPFVTTEEQV